MEKRMLVIEDNRQVAEAVDLSSKLRRIHACCLL